MCKSPTGSLIAPCAETNEGVAGASGKGRGPDRPVVTAASVAYKVGQPSAKAWSRMSRHT